jgi:hypothetical protein
MNTNASLPPPVTLTFDIPLPLWAIATIVVAALVGIVAIIVLIRRKKSN